MIPIEPQTLQLQRQDQISFTQKSAEIFSYSLPLIFLGLSSFASKIPSDDDSSIEYKKFINSLISLSTSILSCGFGGYLGCQIRKKIDRDLLVDNSLENSNYYYSNKILFNIGFTILNSIVSASISYGYSDSDNNQKAIEYGSAGAVAFGTFLNALAMINDRNHRKKRSIFLNIGQSQNDWASAEITLEINNQQPNVNYQITEDQITEDQLTEDQGLTIISSDQQNLDSQLTEDQGLTIISSDQQNLDSQITEDQGLTIISSDQQNLDSQIIEQEFELYNILKEEYDKYKDEIARLSILLEEIILEQEKFEKEIYIEFDMTQVNEELFKLIIFKLNHEGLINQSYTSDDLDQLIDKFKFEFLEKSKKIDRIKFIQALKTSDHQEFFLEQLQKINQLSTFLESIQPESNLPRFLDHLNSLNQLSVFLDAFRKLGHPNKFISDDLIKNSSEEDAEPKKEMNDLDLVIEEDAEPKNEMDDLDFIILDFIDKRERELKLFDQIINQHKKDLKARKNFISLRNSYELYINLLSEAETKINELDLKFKFEEEKIKQDEPSSIPSSSVAKTDETNPIILSSRPLGQFVNINS